MKELRSKKMRTLIARGKRRATRNRRPGDGMLTSLIYETLPNGWHYQVEWIHDTRFAPKPYIVAYAFRPPHGASRAADYYLQAA